jgi:thiamine biosynthesis lipoprotein
MSLDVGAVAKSFAAGLAAEAAKEAGMPAGLINAGGNIVAFGQPPGRGHWSIGIQNPETNELTGRIFVTGRTVSASNNKYRPGHIIDPATLLPANRFRQVVAVHECPAMADLLSTAIFILPRDEGEALAQQTGVEVFWCEW